MIRKLLFISIFFISGLLVMWKNPYTVPEKNPFVGDFILTCPETFLALAKKQFAQASALTQKADDLFLAPSGVEDLQKAYEYYQTGQNLFESSASITKKFSLPLDRSALQSSKQGVAYCSQKLRMITAKKFRAEEA